jgi:hypothetical protein
MFPSTGAARHVMVQVLRRVGVLYALAHLEVSGDNLRLGLIVSLVTFCSNITQPRSCRTGSPERLPGIEDGLPSHLSECA